MFLLHPAPVARRMPIAGPPRVLFTRMTPASETWCAECGSPRMFRVEDFTGLTARMRRRGEQPVSYLKCAACGSREQALD